jgi:hypothetical protein
MPLQEFSKIVILRDTPESRFLFGPPINENSIVTANINARDSINPFYTRLSLIGATYMIQGWRDQYPNFNIAINPDVPGATYDPFDTVVRNNFRSSILQTMTNVEESSSNGYNKPPQSAGTAIIFEDKLYVGSTSKKTYTAISTGANVTVTGTGFAGIAVGSKIKLSLVTETNLSTTTTYYAYDIVGSTSLKLASSLAFATAGTPITSATGSFSGSAELTVAASGATYTQYTGFTTPATNLGVGDFIFWGDDPNSLKIGGKITKVYVSGTDAEYALGARYQFAKTTEEAFPIVSSDIVPQEIYYYRSTWNGKGIKNNEQKDPSETGGGFYVLIGTEGTKTNRIFPYLGFDQAQRKAVALPDVPNSPEERVIGNDLYAFTDLIRIRRISKKFIADQTWNDVIELQEEIIPCTIHRTNNFYFDYNDNGSNTTDWQNGKLVSVHGGPANTGGFASWCAYYVNPYGGKDFKLDKNTTYVLEVNERLPSVNFTSGNAVFNFAVSGSI